MAPLEPGLVEPAPGPVLDAATLARLPVGLSTQARLVDLPCLDAEFVVVKQAICHPGLDGPLAFLGGHEVAPLLKDLQPGQTIAEIARGWTRGLPLEKGIALAHWMLTRGVLVAQGGRA